MRWQAGRLLSAPHRLAFFAAAVLLATTALWWAVALACRHAGVVLPWALPPALAHGLLFTMGFMPLFFAGFLFTAGPRWLDLPAVNARRLLAPIALFVGGWGLAMPGLHLAAGLAAGGLALVALGWSLLLGQFVALLRASRAPDRLHASVVAASGGVGVAALWIAVAGLAGGEVDIVRAATRLALWGFIAPVFAAVSHRMLPFFTAGVLPQFAAWRPDAVLWAMLAALWLQLPGALAELWWWPLPAPLRWAQCLLEAVAAGWLLWLAWRWGLAPSFRNRLLAMLHAAFAWLGIALALAALSHGLMAASSDSVSLGLAPLHALTIGYLGATLFAMATRVSAGHSGRPLAADDVVWVLYWAVHVAALARVTAALWTAAAAALTLAAALAWCLAAVGWAWRYGNWLGRPRADGRPG